jgi:fumarylpyruvate hydrolase
MGYVVKAPAIVGVPVHGSSDLFPVRRILCVGRNYAAHAREMGADTRDPPFFFAKPADAVVLGDKVPYPVATHDLHHEIELVVALKSGGANIAVEDALSHVFGYAVGVDLTRRDLQAAAKAKSHPWDAAKGFDASAPISAIVPADRARPDGAITLSVNSQLRQSGQIAAMIWTVPALSTKPCRVSPLPTAATPSGVPL